jgi:cytoskeletal protein CcmA (bactofilin family)
MFNKTSNPFAKPQTPPPVGARSALPTSPQTAHPATQPAAAKPAPVEPPAEPKPASVETGSRLIVGPDVKLKSAEILDCDTLVVEGRVEATMDSRVIRIAEHGLYTGKVSIDIAEIHGHFEGELTARSQLLIHATGKVSGKVRYGKMLIEEGGQISGEIKSLAEEEAASLRPRPEMLATVKTAAG